MKIGTQVLNDCFNVTVGKDQGGYYFRQGESDEGPKIRLIPKQGGGGYYFNLGKKSIEATFTDPVEKPR